MTNRVTITGRNFGNSAPTVKLAEAPIAVQSYDFSSQTLVANLPAGIAPGSYLLTVTAGGGQNQTADFNLTIGAVGPKGPQGLKGDIGPMGPQGPFGAAGATGAVGPQGPFGAAGATGAVGPQGPKGEQGPFGAAGATGQTGPQGPKGEQGPFGPAGATGQTGLTGPQGPVGPAGGGVGGSGTASRIAKWTDVGDLGLKGVGVVLSDSMIIEQNDCTHAGGCVDGIGIATNPAPLVRLNVDGGANTAVSGHSTNGAGISGSSDGITLISAGVSGHGRYGVLGTSTQVSDTDIGGAGVVGTALSTADGVQGQAVWGTGVGGASEFGHGVGAYSKHGTALLAVVGGAFADLGQLAGEFWGDVHVAGMLSKSGGSFKIDHPLDPENKFLYHSFVESPDMMNLYNGTITLDFRGEATVELPDWFGALNKDFRYGLTAIGAPGPNLYIAAEVSNNHFSIAGGSPGSKVSWQVTGIRQDAYANAHRIKVEEDKSDKERGYYLHPEVFGQPAERQIEWALHPKLMQQMKDQSRKGNDR